jgi:hypothetical protein
MDEANTGRRIGRRTSGNRRKSIREEMRKSERRNCEEDNDGEGEGSRLKRQSFPNFVLQVLFLHSSPGPWVEPIAVYMEPK